MKNQVKYVTFLVVFCVLLTGCKKQLESDSDIGQLTRFSASFFDVFDTQTTIIGYAESQEEFDEKVELLKEKLKYYHRLYDIYHTYEGMNNIKTINDNAGKEPVIVDGEIIDLLKMSREMYDLTSGEINVTMGSVLEIWHDYREEGRKDPENAAVPPIEDLETAAEHMNIENLVIDEEASTAYLKDAEMSIDVGGIGKGYAVQKTAEYAKEIGFSNALISVGGNTCALGEKQDGSMWKIGIQNPDLDSDKTYVAKVYAKDVSVVTSGDYQRYYIVDGVKYCHIIHPDTLMPADEYASVTIVAKDSGMADALSTAVYNMTMEDGRKLIDELIDVEALWVKKDGTLIYSEGFSLLMDEM
ncbi:MAG: FAD:protein FMN transferase [Schaedlerella sp.]|nr:FAD:protein FMN transferase [Schaedlerella sp.]